MWTLYVRSPSPAYQSKQCGAPLAGHPGSPFFFLSLTVCAIFFSSYIIGLFHAQLGKVIAAISQGRKDVMGALKRTRYKEMRRSALEAKNPAKKTRLPLGFHIRDLLGLGMIRELDTPSGMFLRLAPDA